MILNLNCEESCEDMNDHHRYIHNLSNFENVLPEKNPSFNKVRGVKFNTMYIVVYGRHSGVMVSAVVSGSSSPGWSPGQGHCVVSLGKTLNSHSASLHPGA